MSNRLGLPCLLLPIFACTSASQTDETTSSISSTTLSTGQGMEETGDPQPDIGVCGQLLDCLAVVSPESAMANEVNYGPGGACWTTFSAEECLSECQTILDSLANNYPDVDVCQECIEDADCPAETPYCYTDMHECNAEPEILSCNNWDAGVAWISASARGTLEAHCAIGEFLPIMGTRTAERDVAVIDTIRCIMADRAIEGQLLHFRLCQAGELVLPIEGLGCTDRIVYQPRHLGLLDLHADAGLENAEAIFQGEKERCRALRLKMSAMQDQSVRRMANGSRVRENCAIHAQVRRFLAAATHCPICPSPWSRIELIAPHVRLGGPTARYHRDRPRAPAAAVCSRDWGRRCSSGRLTR